MTPNRVRRILDTKTSAAWWIDNRKRLTSQIARELGDFFYLVRSSSTTMPPAGACSSPRLTSSRAEFPDTVTVRCSPKNGAVATE